MKALVLTEPNHFELEDVPKPEPGPGEVVVRVKACGICGSDIHGMDGSSGRRLPPIIMGHEAAGLIDRVGNAVADWSPGDRVTFDSMLSCGDCHFCSRGQTNLCDSRRVLGISCPEFRCDGAFAEYVAVPQNILYRLPDGLSFEKAAMVEPLSVAVHAVARLPIMLGDTAVVIGSGMIGLLVVQVLRLRGCGQILAVDVEPGRLELALSLGADAAFSPETADVFDEVFRQTAGRGADLAVEAVGKPATVAMAIDTVRKGGSVALVGNVVPEATLPLQTVVTREISLFGSCASSGEYPTCLRLIASGAVNLDPLLSQIVPLSDAPAWFARLYQHDPTLIKVLARP